MTALIEEDTTLTRCIILSTSTRGRIRHCTITKSEIGKICMHYTSEKGKCLKSRQKLHCDEQPL